MGCSSCAKAAKLGKQVLGPETSIGDTIYPAAQTTHEPVVVEKSATKDLVKLRYYGGGMTAKAGSGCRVCGGSGTKYAAITTETISFVSEDSPNNYFKRTFTVGHDYWVTEKQAEYLLTLTYQSRARKIVHKFERVKE